jgi:hypothetical protein
MEKWVPNMKIGKIACLRNYHVGVGCFQDSRFRRKKQIFSKELDKYFPPATPSSQFSGILLSSVGSNNIILGDMSKS